MSVPETFMTQKHLLTWSIFDDIINIRFTERFQPKNIGCTPPSTNELSIPPGQFSPYKQFLPFFTPFFKLFYDTIYRNDLHPSLPYFKHLSLLPPTSSNILAPIKIVIVHLPPLTLKITFF